MPNTIYIALQCCQCSMMQVKQKKKSSNKWTCVVCNQKQSVRKVFAQGFMAKDLRAFVQSFNISRSGETEQGGVGDGLEAEIEVEMTNKKLKLNEYQTITDGKCYGVAEGDDELPKTFFDSLGHGQVGDEEARASSTTKRNSPLAQDDKEATTMAASKWSNYMTQNDKEPRPKKTNVVSKWSSYMTQDDTERTSSQATMGTSASKWRDYINQDDKKPPRTEEQTKTKAASTRVNRSTSNWCEYMTGDEDQRPHLPTRVGKAASKWDNYLTHEEDGLERVSGRKTVDHISDWSNGVFETTTNDQKVEDDIHPDFI
ncbi:MRN complex-interacting protein-like isoform X2 [Mangifera indica]|uniref:MRN complex-interacting protein-like isoform X2 n=1 Tax=Mangifera indica TaxID=29780 RepID=UPI001CFB56C8|nr:MRN complex-interacting protein-like isoform X2 [Mangifera indica]